MKPLIIANWKMKMLPSEQRRMAATVVRMTKGQRSSIIALCPTYENLTAVSDLIKGSQVRLCAQDCFWEERGAYTGEVSPRALRQIGCRYVLIGHSERRIYLGETDEMVAQKVAAVERISGLQSILCIGESSKMRMSGTYLKTINEQLVAGLRLVPRTSRQRIIIAYEPLWALSTAAQLVGTAGKPITPSDCAEVYRFLKRTLAKMRPAASAMILYGGSVDGENARSFVRSGIADGALVGGASVDHKEFKLICKNLSS